MPAGRPQVSIIIPSYNYGCYLERAILSALGQLPPGVAQIIVADGGSTDETPKILEKYRGHIHAWSRPDKGFVDAVTQALDIARADVVGILSADDFYLPGACVAALDGLRRYPEAAFVTGRELFIDEAGQVIKEVGCADVVTALTLLKQQIPPQNATFVRREWIDRVGGLRLLGGSSFAADVDLWYRILHWSHGRSIPETLSVWQMHPAQMTRQLEKIFDSLAWMMEDCAANPSLAQQLSMSERERKSILAEMEMFWLSRSPATHERSLAKARQCLTASGDYHRSTRRKARQLLRPQPGRLARLLARASRKILSVSTRLRQSRPMVELDWWKSVRLPASMGADFSE